MTIFDFVITEMKPYDVVMTSSNSFLWMDDDGDLHYSNVKPDTVDKPNGTYIWSFEQNTASKGHQHWLDPMHQYAQKGKSHMSTSVN